ncbi:hypothetical protein [Deinococcus multiflagellatus]|uniref:hypothetical protein n=1 Tax=Deinococcus multiflagellatus TaxID=1656887 RepID=UPI001CC9A06D|nr:hypothetical protein [Deinococcus multiflagellatus]MBZ9715335.1 hypothetical protein [Deinococcus multiflagellatus]
MTWLRFLTLLLTGRLALISTDPRETVLELQDERIHIDTTWNRATGEGRVITNMSRRVATELHTDLGTVPAPAESTRKFTEGLGLAVYRGGGKA